MSCICKICGITFEANPLWHHPTGFCGDECRGQARRIAKEKYKKTDKGHATYIRWCANPIKKEIDKRGMQKPTAKAKAVIRATRTLANNPHLQERKRERDKAFGKTEYGREINKRASAKYGATPKGVASRKVGKARRRSLEQNADGSFTAADLIARFESFGNRCVHCGSLDHITADHIIPLKLGGNNFICNIQPLCGSCNSRKGARYVG